MLWLRGPSSSPNSGYFSEWLDYKNGKLQEEMECKCTHVYHMSDSGTSHVQRRELREEQAVRVKELLDFCFELLEAVGVKFELSSAPSASSCSSYMETANARFRRCTSKWAHTVDAWRFELI